MREMTQQEIADHRARMGRISDQMPDDVWRAIRIVAHWIDMPDGWDETVGRKDAMFWQIEQRVNWEKPIAPYTPKQPASES